jgi:hypothetical protein
MAGSLLKFTINAAGSPTTHQVIAEKLYKLFQNLLSSTISALDRGGQSSKLGTRSKRVGSERSKEIVDYYCGCPFQSALILHLTEGFEVACRIWI